MKGVCIVLGVLAAFAAPQAKAIPLYVFDSVASTSPGAPGGDASINRRPSIADTGEVVLAERYLDGGVVRERIRVVAEDGTSRIAADEAAVPLDLDFDTNPVISDDGTYISFAATDGDGKYGIYRVDNAGLVTRIVREGDLDSKFVPVSNLTCRTGCPVSNYQAPNQQGEPTLDGRVAFYKLQGPPGTLESGSIAAGRGGKVYPLKSGPNATPNMHQANTGQVYYIVENYDGVLSTIDGSSSSQVIYQPSSGYYNFGEVALETFATNGPMTATVMTARTTGKNVVLQRDEFGDFVEVADSVGPFESFRDLSINKYQDIVFGAELDVQGSGIFAGGNAALDRVIGPGDVLFGQVVTSVGLQKAEALNDDGKITLWVELSDGSQHILRAQTFGSYLADQKAQISLPSGSTALSTVLNGGTDSVFGIEVGLEFLTGTGVLDLMLGNTLLGSVRAESLAADGILRLSGISPTPFLEADRLGIDPVFAFHFSAPTAASIRIDDLKFLDAAGAPLGIVRNGDFETGYLEGWSFQGPDGATAFVKAVATAPVPLPAGMPLLLLALVALVLPRRRSA